MASINFMELVPSEWREREGGKLYLTAYAASAGVGFPGVGVLPVNLGDCVLVAFKGRLKYLANSAVSVGMVNGEIAVTGGEGLRETDDGHLLVFIAPMQTDEGKALEEPCRRAIAEKLALIRNLFGRDVVFGRIFENHVDAKSGEVSAPARIVDSPLDSPDVLQSHERFHQVALYARAIQSRTGPGRGQALLSLIWAERALTETEPFVVFTSLWLAIEVLMGTASLGPIKKALSQLYAFAGDADFEARTNLTRLAALRARVLHRVASTPIPDPFITYLEALYADLLAKTLGLPNPGRLLPWIGQGE